MTCSIQIKSNWIYWIVLGLTCGLPLPLCSPCTPFQLLGKSLENKIPPAWLAGAARPFKSMFIGSVHFTLSHSAWASYSFTDIDLCMLPENLKAANVYLPSLDLKVSWSNSNIIKASLLVSVCTSKFLYYTKLTSTCDKIKTNLLKVLRYLISGI